MKNEIIKLDELGIKDKIYSIRGYQVMFDTDLAELYHVQVKRLNEQVKRNIGRFPITFCFRLSIEEVDSLRCQFSTLDKAKSLLRSQIATAKKGGRTNLPYAFTEQGVAMLSAILRSDTAIEISVKIMSAFVEMRKFINSNAQIFQRLDRVEVKQIETDHKFEEVFSALENQEDIPKQGIFFDGQIFDAYNFVSDLFKRAKESVTIIDNYIDNSVLIHLTEVKENIKVKILTRSISPKLKQGIKKFEDQYFSLTLKVVKNYHDRFIIIDEKEVYHIGASLKDLGKKIFAFSRMDKTALNLLNQIEKIK